MPRRLVLLAAVALLFLVPAVAEGGAWLRPVQGGVVAGFTYDREAPFQAGRRRGIDLRADPGSAVRAACAGRVSFAGRLPGRRGRGVTVRCGGLSATHVGLATTTVRTGVRVRSGTAIGELGSSGILRLGARRTDDRFGYLDPTLLFDREGPGLPVLGPAPRGARPRPAPVRAPTPRATPSLAPARRPAPAGRLLPSPASSPLLATGPNPAAGPAQTVPVASPAPLLAWLGAALLALAAGGGAQLRRRHRTRPRTGTAAASTLAARR